MALKAEELKAGCFHNARDDEPIFVLRAKDIFAPVIVEEWANCVSEAVQGVATSEADASRRKVKYARALAHQMRAWQEMNSCKVPD